MKRTDVASRDVDLHGSGKDGFSNGDVASAQPPTVVDADWANGVQEEIVGAIEARNITPSGADLGQLLDALRRADDRAMVQRAQAIGTSSGEFYFAAAEDVANGRVVFVGGDDSIRFNVVTGAAPDVGTFTTSHNIYAVVYDATLALFIACGDDGAGSPVIYTSADGITWTSRTPAGSPSGTFYCIASNGAGTLVIGGDNGAIQYSTDGVNWLAGTAAGSYSDTFRGAACDGTTFVLAGNASEIQTATSPGGTWTARTPDSSLGANQPYRAAGYHATHGFWLIGGDGLGGACDFQHSVAGTTWEQSIPSTKSPVDPVCVVFTDASVLVPTEGAALNRWIQCHADYDGAPGGGFFYRGRLDLAGGNPCGCAFFDSRGHLWQMSTGGEYYVSATAWP